MHNDKKTEYPEKESDFIINMMLMFAENMLNNGDEQKAVEQYKSILELTPNAEAQYNLASLYAQGRGTYQDFCEAAYWFRQAEKNGIENAGKMALKCEMDYIQKYLGLSECEDLYKKLKMFVERVYSEETADSKLGHECSMFGVHYINNKHDYDSAAKLLRTGAVYCKDGWCQNYLGVLYNAGVGVEKNDLISLYWFDCAVENGIEEARVDRDGILDAYLKSLNTDEFKEYMCIIAGWCETGTKDVPKTSSKVYYWKNIANGGKWT
ncbi:MAG: tetratricopeptide repeat protein [Acutalibacteraceae bacterium]|nr:tetratricopeptide repeat protein [Acutalibacteraceae bacterium]